MGQSTDDRRQQDAYYEEEPPRTGMGGLTDNHRKERCSGWLGLAGACWGGSSINTSGDLSLEEAYQVCGLMDPL